MDKPKMIHYGRQWIDEDDIQAVVDVLRSDFLTMGPAIGRFDDDLSSVCGVRHAVCISNGTAALHAAMVAADVGPGDEVVTSPITFAASANCALYVGARPVFADIDPVTYNIDPDDIERKITPRTKAIVPVHFTGQPYDMDRVNEIARAHRLTVIADGAHVIGAKYKGKPVAQHADMTTLSFHPVKQVTTGEGGAIVTDNAEYCDRMKMFRGHGITRDPAKIQNSHGPWYYEQQSLGYNYRMTDIQATLGSSQLKKLPMFLAKRAEYAGRYTEAFSQLPGVITPWQHPDSESAWHLYILKLDAQRLDVGRLTIFQELWDIGIGVNVHYLPVYWHPYYQSIGYEKGLCPQAENLYENILTLPLYPAMTDNEVQRVIDAVQTVIGRHLIKPASKGPWTFSPNGTKIANEVA